MSSMNVREAEERAKLLRESHAETVVPPCRVCGGKLSIDRIGGGEPTRWACVGSDHYGESIFVAFVNRRHPDPDVLALCDDVEALLALARPASLKLEELISLTWSNPPRDVRELLAKLYAAGLLEE